MKLDDYQ